MLTTFTLHSILTSYHYTNVKQNLICTKKVTKIKMSNVTTAVDSADKTVKNMVNSNCCYVIIQICTNYTNTYKNQK